VVAWTAALLAVLLQGALLTRLHVPLSLTPVVVVVCSMRMTRNEAVLLGFFAGLVLDLAPPAEGLLGVNALVMAAAAFVSAANQSLVPQVWWLRAVFAGAVAALAFAVALAAEVLAGQSLVLGWASAALVGWQFVLGTVVAVALWPVMVAAMGPPPRRRMGVAP
jgi:rod shape-determining protein MreD